MCLPLRICSVFSAIEQLQNVNWTIRIVWSTLHRAVKLFSRTVEFLVFPSLHAILLPWYSVPFAVLIDLCWYFAQYALPKSEMGSLYFSLFANCDDVQHKEKKNVRWALSQPFVYLWIGNPWYFTSFFLLCVKKYLHGACTI